MKKDVTCWKNTQRALGFRVVWERFWNAPPRRRTNRKREQAKQSQQYQTLEPRQLLAGDVFGASTKFDQLEVDAVAHWSFDESSGDVAHEVSNNDGQIIQGNSGPSPWKIGSGISGNAIELDGDDEYVDISAVADQILQTEFSISGWIKTDGHPPEMEAVIGVNASPQPGFDDNKLMLFVLEDGTLALHEKDAGGFHGLGTVTPQGQTGPDAVDVTDDQWHHVAVTRSDSGLMKLYLDGSEQFSYQSNVVFESTDLWSLGQRFDDANTSNHFDGSLDSFRVFNHEVLQKEIELLSTGLSDHLVVSNPFGFDDGDYRLGQLSLDEALILAKKFDGLDRITFASGIGGLIETDSTLVVDSDVSIEGPGAFDLTVSTSNSIGLFKVLPGVKASLSGLTISDGDSSNGSGIFSEGHLEIEETIFAANSATGKGAAIYQSDGSLRITGSRFSDNYGGEQGAIYATDADLRIESSLFRDNISPGAPSLQVEGSDSTVFVASSTFANNRSHVHSPDIAVGADGANVSNFYATNLSVVALGGYGGYSNGTAGISVFADHSELHNSIVNRGQGGDLHGAFNSLTYNLVGYTQLALSETNVDLPFYKVLFLPEIGNPYSGRVEISGDAIANTPFFQTNTPALNSGNNEKAFDPVEQESLQTDQLGNPRFIGQVDIGAQELLLAISFEANKLTIDNREGGAEKIVLSVRYDAERAFLVVNDQPTDIQTKDIAQIEVRGSDFGETIDLSAVNELSFPNLNGDFESVQIFGNDGNDQIYGPETSSTIEGAAGDDTIYAGPSADIIHGGDGNDVIFTGDGGDDGVEGVKGGAGDDLIHGGVDNDLIFGGDGNDIIYGGKGEDTLKGEADDDELIGGDEELIVGDEGDILEGGDGDDVLRGGEGFDKLYGGTGDDTLEGGAHNDELQGNEGDDTYVFAGNSDLGSDTLFESDQQGSDTLHFGALEFDGGVDVDLSDPQPGTPSPQTIATNGDASLIVTLGSGSDDRFFENVIGSSQNDQIIGNEFDNTLEGAGGDDTLDGVSGDDTVWGGIGDDTFQISSTETQNLTVGDEGGSDTLDLSELTLGLNDQADVVVDLSSDTPLQGVPNVILSFADGSRPVDNVTGTQYSDTLIGDERVNELRGGKHATIDGNGGDDVLVGGVGDQILDASNVDKLSDDSSEFTTDGSWQDAGFSGGFNQRQLRAESTDPGDTHNSATWTFANLDANAEYRVYVTWTVPPLDTEAPAIASQAGFSVAVNGLVVVQDESVDQAIAPSGIEFSDRNWHQLGSSLDKFQIGSEPGELSVTLSSENAGGLIYADAVWIQRVVNQAPTLSIGTQLVAANADWSFDINQAGDPDGDVEDLKFELPTDSPVGLSISDHDNGTATLLWPAEDRPEGTSYITVLVTDSGSPPATTPVTIQIHSSTDGHQHPYFADDKLYNIESDGNQIDGANDDAITVEELTQLSFSLDVTDDSGTELIYSLGPDAPAEASIDQNGNFTWTPGELDSSPTAYPIELRVTNQAQPPLRVTHTVEVTVEEVNSDPVFVSLPTLSDPNPSGVNPIVTGKVANDGDALNLEVVVDVATDAQNGDSEYEKTYPYTATMILSEDNPGEAAFVFEPNIHMYPNGSISGSLHLSFQVRESDSDGVFGIVDATNIVIVSPDVANADTPEVTVQLRQGDEYGETNPVIDGVVTHSAGVSERLDIRVYEIDGTSSSLVATIEADENGLFEYLPASLQPGLHTFAFVAEKETSFADLESDIDSIAARVTFLFEAYQSPTITTLGLLSDTGDNDADGITSDMTVIGQIYPAVEGITIEFDDNDDGVIDGSVVTEEDGSFTYIATNASTITGGVLKARVVAWDAYAQQLVAEDWSTLPAINSISLTFDESANATAEVTELDLKFPVAGIYVNDPMLTGRISNDGPAEEVTIEFFIFEDNPENPGGAPIRTPLGATVANEDGSFEFRPAGLEAGVEYTIFARALEFDQTWTAPEVIDPERDIYEGMLFYADDDPQVKSQILFIEDSPVPVTNFVGAQLDHDSGVNVDDSRTNDPTVSGHVQYVGDYSQLVVEFTLDAAPGEDAEVIGTVIPDDEGNFSYTLEDLTDGDTVNLNARVRVPDYGFKSIEFVDDNGGTNSFDDNAYINSGNYDSATREWIDDDENGVADIVDDWFADIFNEDRTDFNQDGSWYQSGFQRDWESLFSDETTEWVPTPTFTYDTSENDSSALTVTLVSLKNPSSGSQFDPTIIGTVENDGTVDGLLVEVYLNGSSEPDGTAVTDPNGQFTYVLQRHQIGSNQVSFEVYEPVYGSEDPTSTTTSGFTVDIDTNPDLGIAELKLVDGRIENSQLEAIDSTLVGTVQTIGTEGAIVVLFDYDYDDLEHNGLDGVHDGQTTTDGNGAFEFTPGLLKVDGNGMTTVAVQVVEEITDPQTEERYRTLSSWEPISWKVLANEAPEIVFLELKHDSFLTIVDAQNPANDFAEATVDYQILDRVTVNPTLIGKVANDNGVADLLVEFDHDGDGEVDGDAVTGSDGYFEYTPVGLDKGGHDIRVRVTEIVAETGALLVFDYNNDATGWARLTATGIPLVSETNPAPDFYGFTLTSPSAATISELEQAHIDSVTQTGSIVDPTLTGTVIDADGAQNTEVEFYLNVKDAEGVETGEQEFLGSVNPDADGVFFFLPAGLDFTRDGSGLDVAISITAVVKKFNHVTGELSGVSQLTTSIAKFRPIYDDDGLSNGVLSIKETDEDKFQLKHNFHNPSATNYDPFDPTVTGVIAYNENATPDKKVVPEYVEISIDGIVVDAVPVEFDTPSGPTGTTFGYRFSYTPQLESSSDAVTIKARPVGSTATGYIFGGWVETDITFDLKPSEVVTTPEAGWEWEDTNSLSPTLLADITGGPVTDFDPDQPPLVEFDWNGDGVVDDSLSAEEVVDRDGVTHNFRHTFEYLDPDTTEIRVRVTRYELFKQDVGSELSTELGNEITDAVSSSEFDSDLPTEDRNETIVGQWITIPLNIADPTPFFVPNSVQLRSDIGIDSPEATDPTVVGAIDSSQFGELDSKAGLTIEVDHDGDGISDGDTITAPDGTFVYTPQDLEKGSVKLRFRVVDRNSENEPLVSEWDDLHADNPKATVAFEYREIDKPIVDSIELELNENPDGTTSASNPEGVPESSNPRLIGTVGTAILDEAVNELTIEFDHDGDGTVDGSVIADYNGSFIYSPSSLPYGAITIRSRAVAQVGNDTITGDWAEVIDDDGNVAPPETSATKFFHASAVPPIISDLEVADPATGEIIGRVTVEGFGLASEVEVAVLVTPDSDPDDGEDDSVYEVNGTAYTDENGFFRYVPYRLTANLAELHVRGLLDDPSSSKPITGDWQTMDFSGYDPEDIPSTFPSIVSVGLEHDTGSYDQTDALAADTITADTTIVGQVSQYVPGMEVLLFNWDTLEGVYVPVRSDATFEHVLEADTMSGGYVTAIRLWDPVAGTMIEGDYNWGQQFNITFDNSENLPARIGSINLRNNESAEGEIQFSNDPTFIGQIENDGNLGGHSVRFDHNQDGIYDGTAITQPDGTFVYRANDLPTGTDVQSIDVWVEELDYFGDVVPEAVSTPLSFVLASAPRVAGLNYSFVDNSEALTHTVNGTAQLTDGHAGRIEYVLFANGLSENEPPENIQNYQAGSQLHSTTLNADKTFTINLNDHVGLESGRASLSARVVNETTGAIGPWESETFFVVSSDSTTLTINNFGLVENTGDNTDNLTSNPAVSGRIDKPFATIELTMNRTGTDGVSVVKVFRTVADADGKFSFVPDVADLNVGSTYSITAAHVHYDPDTGQEVVDSTGVTEEFELVNKILATINGLTSAEGASGLSYKGTGTVTRDDGNTAGLRIEYDTDGDYEANGFTFTDAAGHFEFPIYDVVANVDKVVRVRIVEWDGTIQEYHAEPFSEIESGDAGYLLIENPQTNSVTSNEFEEDTEDSLAAADSALIDAITGHLDDLGFNDTDPNSTTTPGTIDLVFGEFQFRQHTDSEFLSDTTSGAPVLVNFDSQLPDLSVNYNVDVQDADLSEFTTPDGAVVEADGTYSFKRTVLHMPLGDSTFVNTSITYSITLDDYARDSGSDGTNQSALGMSSFYQFIYSGTTVYDTSSGDLISINSQAVTEISNYDFNRTISRSTDGSDYLMTVVGSKNDTYSSEDVDFENGALHQDFYYQASSNVEVWEDETLIRSSDVQGGTNTTNTSNSGHAVYGGTFTDSGTISITASGDQTVSGSQVVTETTTATGEESSDSNFSADYGEKGSSSGSSSSAGSYLFTSNFDATTNYKTGVNVDTSWQANQTLMATGSAGGSGNSSNSNDGNTDGYDHSRSESWSYNGTSGLDSTTNSYGTILEDHSGSKLVTTWSSNSVTEGTSTSGGGSNGSVEWSNSRDGTSNRGSGSGTASFSGSSKWNDLTVANGIDDDTWANSVGGVSSQSIYSSDSNSNGSRTVSKEGVSESSFFNSQSSDQVDSSGGAGYKVTETPESSVTQVGWSVSSDGTSLVASQGHGSRTEDGTSSVFRSNSAEKSTVTVSGSGSDSSTEQKTNGSTESTDSSSGRFETDTTSDSRSSSFVEFVDNEGTEGFTLTKSKGGSNEDSTVNFSEADGQSNSRGRSTNDSSGSTDTKSVVNGKRTEGNTSTTFSSIVNTGSTYQENGSGNGRQSGDTSSSDGSLNSSGKAYRSSTSTTGVITRDGGSFFSATSTVRANSKGGSSGSGTASTKNGETTSASANGSSDQFARVNASSNYFGNSISSTTAGTSRVNYSGSSNATAQTENSGKGSVNGLDSDANVNSSGSFQNSGSYTGNSRVSGSFNGAEVDSRFGSSNDYSGQTSERGSGNTYGKAGKEDGDGKGSGSSSSRGTSQSTVRANQRFDSGSSGISIKTNGSSNSSGSYDVTTVSRDGYDRTSGGYRSNGSGNSTSQYVFRVNSSSDDSSHWTSGKTTTRGESRYSASGTIDAHDDGRGGSSSLNSVTASANSASTTDGFTKSGSQYSWESVDGLSSGFLRSTNNTSVHNKTTTSLASIDGDVISTSKLRFSSSGKTRTRQTSHPETEGGTKTSSTIDTSRKSTVSIDNRSESGVLTERKVKLGNQSNNVLSLEVDASNSTSTKRVGTDRGSTVTYSTGGGREKLTNKSHLVIGSSHEVDVKDENESEPAHGGGKYQMNDTYTENIKEFETFYSASLNSRGSGRFTDREKTTISIQTEGSTDYEGVGSGANRLNEIEIKAESQSTISVFNQVVRSGAFGRRPSTVDVTARSTNKSSYEHRRTEVHYRASESGDTESGRTDTTEFSDKNSTVSTITTSNGKTPQTVVVTKNRSRSETRSDLAGYDALELGYVYNHDGSRSGVYQYTNRPYNITTTQVDRRETSNGVSGTERVRTRNQTDAYYSHEEGDTGYSWSSSTTDLSTGVTVSHGGADEQHGGNYGPVYSGGSGAAGSGDNSGSGNDNSSSSSNGSNSARASYNAGQFSQRVAFNGNGGGGSSDSDSDGSSDNNGDGDNNSNDPTPQNLLNDFYNSTNDATREWLDGLPPEGRQAVGEELHRRHLKAAEEQRQRNAPQIGPCNHALVQWAFQDENNDNPLALQVRSEYRGFMGTFLPPGVNHPRRDTQMVFEGFGYIPGVGVGASGVNSLIYGYNGEYGQAFGSALGAGANGLGSRLAGRFGSKFGGRGPTLPNTTKGWKVGDPINNLTRAGNVPSWSAVRQRFWKNEAFNNAQNYSAKNLERMKRGLAPQRINPNTGKLESMELHHTPPQCEGGLFDVEPVWPDEHALIDPYRHTGN